MPCDLPYNCFNCPELLQQQYIDRTSPVEVRLMYCHIARQGSPTDPICEEMA